MKYLALGLVGLFWFVCSPVPEAHSVVTCRAGYYPHATPVSWSAPWDGATRGAGIRICR